MQIGPRIRIGGTLGKIGEKIKGYVPSVASMVGGAMIPGGGAVLGSALNGSVAEDFRKGATNVPLVLAGTQLAAGGPSTGTGGTVASAAGDVAGRGTGSGGGGTDWLSLILGGGSALSAAKLGQQSTDYATKAYGQAQDNWTSRQPLRMAGVHGMLNAGPSKFGADAIANMGTMSGRNPFATPAIRMAPPPVSSVPSTLPPGTVSERDKFALGDPNQPLGAPGTRTGVPPLRIGGPLPDVYNGVPTGMGLSETWNKNLPRNG